jgi:uncharacterized repeat protein (TIGR02543 family)
LVRFDTGEMTGKPGFAPIPAQVVAKGGKPAAVTAVGDQVLLGWACSESDLEQKILCEYDQIPIVGHTTYYAVWGDPIGYTVVFDLDGGNIGEATSYSQILTPLSPKITQPENPTKEDHRFVGWYGRDNQLFDFAQEYNSDNSDLTVMAKWAVLPHGPTLAEDCGTDASSPCEIYNAWQLASLAQSKYLGSGATAKYFKLMDDIDLTDYLNSDGYNQGQGWKPIGTGDGGNASNTFYGNFDGNSRRIIGLWSNRPTETGVGIFGVACGNLSSIGVEAAEAGR